MPKLANRELDYVVRVNRAVDHIIQNLDQPMRLEDIAKVACFSSYHFHRIFSTLVGETLNQFVKRVRLERALYLLSRDPNRSLTELALECGFGSSSDFSRSFKQRYGVPPSAFDLELFRDTRRADLMNIMPDGEQHRLARLPVGENPDGFEIQFRDLPARTIAYIRVHDPYASEGVADAAKTLIAWADKHGVADGQWLGYTWDDPEVVPLERCRYDVGVEVRERINSEGVSWLSLPAMRVAELELKGPIDLEQRALDWVFCTWLPQSGFAPAHQPCFEAWNGRPFEHGYEHFELRLQLPIEDD